MSKELFDKLYKRMHGPYVILSIVLFIFSYQQWPAEVSYSLLLTIVVLGSACVAFYIFFYFLVRNYYMGEKKKDA